MPMDTERIEKIKYALTLRSAEVPEVLEELQAICGCVPQRSSMREDFEACGHYNLLPFWERMVAACPSAANLAREVWANYERHTAALKEGEDPSSPGVGEMAMNFAGALLRDLKAGRPRRTPDEVEAILSICQGCELWRSEENRCGQCGCWIRKKASWAQEHCPLGKW
jgi:hypothetical protein